MRYTVDGSKGLPQNFDTFILTMMSFWFSYEAENILNCWRTEGFSRMILPSQSYCVFLRVTQTL